MEEFFHALILIFLSTLVVVGITIVVNVMVDAYFYGEKKMTHSANRVLKAGDDVAYSIFSQPFKVYGYSDDEKEVIIYSEETGYVYAEPELVEKIG